MAHSERLIHRCPTTIPGFCHGGEIDSRMRQTVKSKYIVDFVVRKSTHVQTPEPEAVRDKVKVLRDMACFEQDEAITRAPPYLKLDRSKNAVMKTMSAACTG